MSTIPAHVRRAPSAARRALILRYWQRNAEDALPPLMEPRPQDGSTFDLRVIRTERGKLVADRFIFVVETRPAPAEAAFDFEFRIVCEGVEVELGRFYANGGAVH